MEVRAQIETSRQKGLMFKSLYEDPELAKLRQHYAARQHASDSQVCMIVTMWLPSQSMTWVQTLCLPQMPARTKILHPDAL